MNAEPENQVNEFHSIFVVTECQGMARIDGKESSVRKGESIFVPAGIRHEYWNDSRRPSEFVIMMVGSGA